METNVVHATPQGAMNPADLSELVMLRQEAKARQEARIAACEAAVEDMRASFEARLDEIAALANEALTRTAEAIAMAQSKAVGRREDAGDTDSACEGADGADGAAQGEGGKPLLRIDMTRIAKREWPKVIKRVL